MIARILKSLFENEAISTLSVDISRNNLGPQSISVLAPSLKIATFNAFDISDNGLRAKGTIDVLASLKSVQRLILDKNWGREDRETEDLAKALGAFLGSHPAVYHLSLVGASGNRFGRSLKTFFTLLSGNNYLEELDYSGNAIGDSVFSVFTSSLPKCSLKSVRCDGNDLTYGAYMTLNRALPKTETLLLIDFPIVDYEASESRLKPKFLEVLLGITKTLYKRHGTTKQRIWRPNPFAFDIKWPTPLNINPLVSPIPPELQALATKLYDGPPPSLPLEDTITPPPTNRYIHSEEDTTRQKKTSRPISPVAPKKSKKELSTLPLKKTNSTFLTPPPTDTPIIPPPPVELPPPPPPSDEMPPPSILPSLSFSSRPSVSNPSTNPSKKNLLGSANKRKKAKSNKNPNHKTSSEEDDTQSQSQSPVSNAENE
jgi:hypothetical protein